MASWNKTIVVAVISWKPVSIVFSGMFAEECFVMMPKQHDFLEFLLLIRCGGKFLECLACDDSGIFRFYYALFVELN